VKSSKISELEAEVVKAKTEMPRFTDKAVKVHGTPSVITSQEPAGPREHGAPSVIPRQEPAGLRVRKGAPSGDERKIYSEAVSNKIFTKKFKLTVKSKEHPPPDTIKGLLKLKINPTEIRV
jgi:hypothetical protein